jgi:hypothetical protein
MSTEGEVIGELYRLSSLFDTVPLPADAPAQYAHMLALAPPLGGPFLIYY